MVVERIGMNVTKKYLPGFMAVTVLVILISLFISVLYLDWLKTPVTLSITIAEAHQPAFALLYIAQENGYFEDESLQVNYRRFTSGRDALEDVLQGHADLATVYETPVVLQTMKGKDIRLLSTLHKSTKNTALLALRKTGIHNPKDLKGKSIGVPFNTNAQFFLSLFLQDQGVDLTDVTFIDSNPQDLNKMLLSGEVDGIAIWNPYFESIKNKFKKSEVVTFNSDVYTEMSVMATLGNTASTKGLAIARVYKALARAEQFLQYSPEQAFNLVLKRFNNQQKSDIRNIWPDIEPTLTLDHVLLNILKEEALWFYSQGVVSRLWLDFETIFYPKYLFEVKPYGVTVSH